MRIPRAIAYGVFLLTLAGCGPGTDPMVMPVTLAQYEASQGNPRKAFPPQVVRLFNLQRAMDSDLAVGAPNRVAPPGRPSGRQRSSRPGGVFPDPG